MLKVRVNRAHEQLTMRSLNTLNAVLYVIYHVKSDDKRLKGLDISFYQFHMFLYILFVWFAAVSFN